MPKSKIFSAFLNTKRKSLSFFGCYIFTIFCFAIANKIVSSLYISFNPQYSLNELVDSTYFDLGFSISFIYGLMTFIVYFLSIYAFSILEIQRLRSIGYRHPIIICLTIFLLNRISNYFYLVAGLNWISIVIGFIVFVYFIALIFLSAEEDIMAKTVE